MCIITTLEFGFYIVSQMANYNNFFIVLSAKKLTQLYSKNLLEKSSGNNFIFLPVFYLTMCLMKASKYFGKIVILKIWELVSLGGAKTHFGKIALK